MPEEKLAKTSPNKILSLIEREKARYVDFRFTDPKGKWQHTSYDSRQVDETLLSDGVMFDGSSIAGWKDINESDMILLPDEHTAFVDPFAPKPTVTVFCDVIEPDTGEGYVRDPRSTARRAEDHLKKTGIADTAYFGPELEFFVFDDVRFKCDMNTALYQIDSRESPINSATEYFEGNTGHRPRVKGGYFPVQPVDSLNDIRVEMMECLEQVGITPVLHHHEVAPSQCELGILYDTLTYTGDNVQKYKYVVHNVADAAGKTATFMPKPIAGDNGSGMHTHQSLWKGGKPLFAGKGYAGLSDMCLYYIGGLIKHAKALNAFTNASTNSYKRLVPGFEAPVLLAYSSRNRSASIRIPFVHSDNARRLECRFPDSSGNPYYTFAAMLMAGLDGIKNKIHPGEAIDRNLYDMTKEELKDIGQVSRSLHMSLETLDNDREFLTAGGVFTDDQIDAYIELKMKEVSDWETSPHPIEFLNYYSV